jgi:hypothetical protein
MIAMTDTRTTRKKTIAAEDVLPAGEYAARRAELRRGIVELKRGRRLEVGPHATFYFECYATMLQQVQEMLHIEKGGSAQLADELAAYNPLIPKGSELVATIMFEIDDPVRRQAFLDRLGGVEHTMFIEVGGGRIKGRAEEDQERTNEAGKASSVQFVRFAFNPEEIAAFRAGKVRVIVGIEHPNYAHMTVMPDLMRQELASDFD